MNLIFANYIIGDTTKHVLWQDNTGRLIMKQKGMGRRGRGGEGRGEHIKERQREMLWLSKLQVNIV